MTEAERAEILAELVRLQMQRMRAADLRRGRLEAERAFYLLHLEVVDQALPLEMRRTASQ